MTHLVDAICSSYSDAVDRVSVPLVLVLSPESVSPE
jgi:hypothetical protein